ncbi:hypothetical protein [Candidatus Albibeggiatoa sp. nov. NOAA]|uniref:hypothetical protein n=1 Tax=Candidatus Albibeggiatoa sp. nov. NOAA TaxID=3162724 RepID=UPI0033013AFA|nr:hypothetical protein [Thiotrichaceae bacterium]
MYINPDFDGVPDVVIHISMIFLKAAIITLFPFALKDIYSSISKNQRNALTYFLTLNLLFIALFFFHIEYIRELFSIHASSNAVKYYYLSHVDLSTPYYVGGSEWKTAWMSFIPQTKELLLGLFCSALMTLWGYWLGARWVSRFGISFILLMICTFAPSAMGLVLWDYDLFMGGVFFDTLSIQLLPFFWLASGSGTTMLFILAFFFYIHGYQFTRYTKQL